MLAFPNFKPVSGGFAPSIKSLSGGQSLSGFEQVVSQFNDRWSASYAFAIRRDADVLAWRAFILAMRGRANSVGLPAFELARAPWAVDAYGRKLTPAFSRSPELDGTAYADAPGFRDGLISAEIQSPANANSTSIIVSILAGSAPLAGHMFSIGSRLYSALSVTGSNPYTIEIWPQLREGLSVTNVVNFTSPICEMRFASDSEGSELLSLQNLRFATMTLKFDEVAI